MACENCHTFTSWKPIRNIPEFDHDKTRYPLRGLHKNVTCVQCHTSLVFSNAGTRCADCHADFHRRQFGSNCEQCHTVKGWQVNLQSIKQHSNRFPLLGAHATLDCESCHKGAATGQYLGLSTDCISCHAKDYKTAQPDHAANGFSTNCQECHTMDTFFGAKVDHSKFGFPLTGAHATLECTACHVNNRFKGTPADCFSCHQKDYNGTNNPPHATAGFSTTCQTCHSTVTWSGAKFDHNTLTKFPLTGAHASVACESCHVNNKYVGTPTDCYSCHANDFNKTTNPNHVQSGFPTTCQTCHTTTAWQPASFDHSKTAFPLTGAHRSVACASCHINNKYAGTPTDCYSCHANDFNKTANPNHVQSGFPTACQTCHTTTAWQPASFDHSKTAFPLTGAHTSVACASCHIDNKYAGTPTDCYSCHTNDFNKTTNPNHVQSGFPTTCQTCHTTTAWQPASFDHSTTGFTLTGAHATLACTACHVNGKFAGTPADCFSCHANDYNKTNTPSHSAAGFPTTCQTCHSTTTWMTSTWNHNTATPFPLTGAHTTVACAACHVNNKFAGTPANCYSCHLNDWNKTTDPAHAAAGFPTDCSICHTTSSWAGAKFDHSQTQFPLTGAHTSLSCVACHASGKYAGLSTTCVSCHQNDYNGATNPNHVASGFPTDCTICHNTTAWQPSTFNHSNTAFPLTGAHIKVACASCHVNGQYAGTPTDCYSCHKTDYLAVTNPNHVAAAFPTTCTTCHNTTSWLGATFNHTWFPIYSGTHAGKWTTCADCHTNPTNYAVFACINCHAHDKTTTDNQHQGVRNYVYNSANCYSCHPTGSGG